MAEHKANKTKVAIKQIDRKVCPAELLVKEVEIMRGLGGCKGVIHLLDVYEDPLSPKTYLVMELVTGGELFDYIVKSSSYSEKSASDYIRQLCQTVEYLHSKNIVHRDLKPENMLFEDPSAQVLKLCDFGLADTLKDDFDFLTLAVGTKSYMAPEVSSNMGYGKPVDMYSIGVILYILLCGYLPIDPENGIYVLEFPPSEWADISIEVKLLIKRLLDDSPAARPTASVVLKHPWIRGTNTSTKPLVGTVRNLKSWNQVGGRAVTKPRGQVMNLFDNPPPSSSSGANGNEDELHTSNDTTTTTSSSHRDNERPVRPSKGERAASPKVRDGRMQKTKKAALPKMIDGVMTPPPASAVRDSPHSAGESATSSTATSPTPKRKNPATPSTATKDKEGKSKSKTAGSADPAASQSPTKPKSSKRKAEEREGGKTPTRSRPTEAPAPGTPSGAPTRSTGDKPAKPVSDRTKQFLKEQEAREKQKKEAEIEKSNRRKSMGTPSRKRAIETTEEGETDTAGKKDKKGAVASPTKDKKAKRKSVAMPRNYNPNDLEAMISNALDDDQDYDDGLKRQRSNSVAVLTPVKTKKKTARGTDLTGGKDGSNESLNSSKKSKTRERSSTHHQDASKGDFSSIGSDSVLAQPSSSKKGSKTSLAVGSDNGDTDYYPRRAGSKPSNSKSKERFATPASSPSSSPPDSATAPVMKVTVRKSAKPPVPPKAMKSTRSSGNLKVVKEMSPRRPIFATKEMTTSSSTGSDSESYGTGQSSSSSSSDERIAITPLEPKKKAIAKKAPPTRSPSSSSD